MNPLLDRAVTNQENNRWRWRALAVAALLGVPVTVFALSGNDAEISYYGWFGAPDSSTLGTGTALAIGPTASWDTSKSGLAVVGSNMNGYDSNSLVVGTMNKHTGGSGDAFVVGMGVGTTDENALEVHKDGTVRLGRIQHETQASMGPFRDPNLP